ncbi:MAG: hypothetical protein ACI4OY_11730 [Aristaeellaceae bacterium]
MHRMFGWIRRGAGWALTIVSALSLLDCLLCMGLTLFGQMEVSSTGEAVGAFFGFALLAAVSGALLFLGWRMRGKGPVLMVPLRCRVERLRLRLRQELSRVKRKEGRLLRPKSWNRPVLLEKRDML